MQTPKHSDPNRQQTFNTFLKHAAGHWYFAKHKCVVRYKSKAKLLPFSFKNKHTNKHPSKQTEKITGRQQKTKLDGKHDGRYSQDTGKPSLFLQAPFE